MPKEEADNAILLFWKMWRKEKAKKKKHAKRLEEKNAKREAKGLPPIEKEKEREALGLPPIEKMKDVEKEKEKEKDRQPYIPADIKTYANCPDTTGLNEEASNKLLFEFYHEFKRNKLKEQKKQKDKKRKEIYDKVMAGEVPEDEEALMAMFEPPEDIATYPGYPNLGNDDNFLQFHSFFIYRIYLNNVLPWIMSPLNNVSFFVKA